MAPLRTDAARLDLSEFLRRGDRIVGMLSLETMGYFSEAEGSQRYPFPFSLFYPSRGEFIGFVSNLGSASFVRRTIGHFRERAIRP